MHTTLADLRGQLDSVQTVQPRREQALREIERAATRLREELRGIEGALSIIAEQRNQQAGLLGQAEAQAYTRGRISAYLGQISTASGSGHIQRLESNIAVAQRLVQGARRAARHRDNRRQTHPRAELPQRTTGHARTLRLEHGDRLVRLDLKKLTIVADTVEGITELLRIGSGKNHVGYHVATHLALHQYFVANSRPVPRFLMLDQPTQPYYPSDMAKQRGRLEDLALDEDRVTVTRLFELMHQVVRELAPNFQMIVSDHADLPPRLVPGLHPLQLAQRRKTHSHHLARRQSHPVARHPPHSHHRHPPGQNRQRRSSTTPSCHRLTATRRHAGEGAARCVSGG